jgi:hypothetical protein
MKVFISWSGERSRRVAELLDEWLQCVIQASEPWMSSKDIDRGALWFTEISDQLAGTGIGIVCLTRENKIKPWILFESGALAKGISSNRVCTLLIDLKPTDVENPLAQFNHTMPNRTGLWELVRTINLALKDESLKESILEKVFDTYWPQFEVSFEQILNETPHEEVEVSRSENDILIELLTSVRGIDRRIRAVENRDIHNSNERILNRANRPSGEKARKMIFEFLDNEMSPELVQEIMAEQRVPSSFVKRVIEDYLKEKR